MSHQQAGQQWRRVRSLVLVATAACASTATQRDDADDPYAWYRCRDPGPAGEVQRELLGDWRVAFRPEYQERTAAIGQMEFRPQQVRVAVPAHRVACKDCLVGEYRGTFEPFLERPPPSREFMALMRGDQTFVMSVGSLSPQPNRGDLSLCGVRLDDTLTGIWWQNYVNGAWGTFVMWRDE